VPLVRQRLAAVAALMTMAGPAAADEAAIRRGKLLFDLPWRVPAGQDAVGPLFNARSCGACHPDGGAGAPNGPALALRTGGDPRLGAQIQPLAVQGLAAEPVPVPAWLERVGPGGQSLARPSWRLGDRELAGRIAPSLRGTGLLARIPEAVLLAAADPDDRDGDGVSGRLRRVDTPDGIRVGRFGAKAGHASLAAQVAEALALDMGLASAGHPSPAGDCMPAQPACLALAGNSTPVPAQAMERLLAYVGGLRPLPTAAFADGGQGQALFAAIGCGSCHAGPYAVVSDPAVTGQPTERIMPFTDLLLHELGPDLADPFADGGAGAGEWRTAPLWGLRARTALLHDGRATTPLAAILWHDGEAAGSRDRFLALTEAEQAELLAFLASL
jgi:CxxC motif-containing protein (DUF1111 family)